MQRDSREVIIDGSDLFPKLQSSGQKVGWGNQGGQAHINYGLGGDAETGWIDPVMRTG